MSTVPHEHNVLACLQAMTALARNGQLFSLESADQFTWLLRRAFEVSSGRVMDFEGDAAGQQAVKQAADELTLAINAAAADEQQLRMQLGGRPRPGGGGDTGVVGGIGGGGLIGSGLLVGIIGKLLEQLLTNPAMIAIITELISKWVSGLTPPAQQQP